MCGSIVARTMLISELSNLKVFGTTKRTTQTKCILQTISVAMAVAPTLPLPPHPCHSSLGPRLGCQGLECA